MPVVHSLSLEGIAVPEPGILVLRTFGFLAPVLGPFDVRVLAQDARHHEGADVESDALVEVGVPADRLFGEGLPAHKNVVPELDLSLAQILLFWILDDWIPLQD